MSSRTRRIVVAAGLALLLLVGGVSANRLSDDDGDSTTTEGQSTVPTQETDPYPLATGTTPKNVQLVVYERAYSECATTEPAALAAKYKTSDLSDEGVAAAVGRGWASYFKAGRDAVPDGRAGCLQALQED